MALTTTHLPSTKVVSKYNIHVLRLNLKKNYLVFTYIYFFHCFVWIPLHNGKTKLNSNIILPLNCIAIWIVSGVMKRVTNSVLFGNIGKQYVNSWHTQLENWCSNLWKNSNRGVKVAGIKCVHLSVAVI